MKTARRPRASLCSLDFPIARRGVRNERVEELVGCLRHLVDGPSESDFVSFGGPREAAQLADELEGRRADLFIRGRRPEVVESLDVSTHMKSLSPAT
jgi:hypothetical protein